MEARNPMSPVRDPIQDKINIYFVFRYHSHFLYGLFSLNIKKLQINGISVLHSTEQTFIQAHKAKNKYLVSCCFIFKLIFKIFQISKSVARDSNRSSSEDSRWPNI